MRDIQKIVIVITVVVVTFVIGYLGLSTFFNPVVYQGSLIDPPLEAKDFTLQDQFGETFKLSDHRGEIVLLFFGYTFCPDVCPTTMADFKRIKEQLGEDAQDVTFVMITADPERDTPEKMGSYVNAFHPDFYGLSGTVEELEAVYADYGVFVEKEDTESENYLVSHTSRIYVVDKAGKLTLTFPYGLEPRAMASDLANLLAGRR